jgi:crotonobetainyl-CoA:carnitine CoA-transferase CaiB-like acyl-CoA transferase
LFTSIEYPELDATIEHPVAFAKASIGGIGIRSRAPRIGEHNAEIYAEIGVDAASLEALVQQGVV